MIQKNEKIKRLIDFLNSSPVSFLAVDTVCRILEEYGYKKLDASEKLPILERGGKYYFTKNDSSVFAFHLGKVKSAQNGFHVICAHSDSPTFRIKPSPEMIGEGGMIRLNTEVYGGPILASWFDRPLSIAGRVILRSDDVMHPQTRLVHIKRPLLTIPNLAIHFNRDVNNGVALKKQKDMLPILGYITKELQSEKVLTKIIAEELSVTQDDILDFDIYLYDTTPACLFGINNEFISSGRLDDLSMVFAGVEALVSSDNLPETTKVLAIFDNEEVGSMTKQGANSNFFRSLLQRIVLAEGGTDDDFYCAVEKSFMVSADNAHALHPNYTEKYDPTNHPLLGGGPVIKYNASQKYATDAYTASVFRMICSEANVPCQRFVNHSDIAGGSTLGNILTASLPFNGVDMGAPILAMHSVRETGSVMDYEYTIKAFDKFYELR